MRTINGFCAFLVSTILCGLAQTAAGQSSAKEEVLAAFAERDKAFLAGDETRVAQVMSEDYLQTDVNGSIQDKQAWLAEYYRPMVPLLRSGEMRLATYDRGDFVVRDFGDTVVVAGKLALKFAGVNPSSRLSAGSASCHSIHSSVDQARRDLEAGRNSQRISSGTTQPGSYGS